MAQPSLCHLPTSGRHTQQHRVFCCFTPPVTHSNTGSSAALPRQSHIATPGLLLYPTTHTQQHRVFCCLTPPVTHSNTGSSDLPRQSQAGSSTIVGGMCFSNCILPSERSRTKITKTLCARPRQCVYTEDRIRSRGENTACTFWTSL